MDYLCCYNVSSAIFKHQCKYGRIDKNIEELKQLVSCLAGERANIYELEDAYERMAYAIQEADHSVTLLTRHGHNKDSNQVNIPEREQKSKNKPKYYNSMLKAIKRKDQEL